MNPAMARYTSSGAGPWSGRYGSNAYRTPIAPNPSQARHPPTKHERRKSLRNQRSQLARFAGSSAEEEADGRACHHRALKGRT